MSAFSDFQIRANLYKTIDIYVYLTENTIDK